MSGSDDTNIRIWKAQASEKIGVKHGREKSQGSYNRKLRGRYSALPEIKRIER